MSLQLRCGDALTELQKLEPESVDCCITSPPYWALRDYKCNGQLGLEPTFQEYINKLVTIFDELKRVLKKTGTCWVVIGDTYSGNRGDNRKPEDFKRSTLYPVTLKNQYYNTDKVPRMKKDNIPEKSLCMIPERFAISMVDHGWILRNKIVWFKPNCMPSSAKDRFTVDWECVFFFVKQQKYFFETQYETMITDKDKYEKDWKYVAKYLNKHLDNIANKPWGGYFLDSPRTQNPLGRIKRCVWKISTKPFSGAHFAVFPPQLIEPMIQAGSPEYICNKCQEPRKLQYEETRLATRPGFDVGNGKSGKHDDPNEMLHRSDLSKYRQQIIRTPRVDSRHFRADGTYYKIGGNKYTEAGLSSGNPNRPRTGNLIMTDCGCNAGFHSSVVIDPFMGSGTVGLVAAQNARDFIGIELNPEYIEMAKKRLEPFIGQERLIVARA